MGVTGLTGAAALKKRAGLRRIFSLLALSLIARLERAPHSYWATGPLVAGGVHPEISVVAFAPSSLSAPLWRLGIIIIFLPSLTRFIHRHPSAAAAPEEGVVRVLFPLLVVEGLCGAAVKPGAERAAFPERPVEPVELLEAPRHFDAAARLGVIRRAAAAGDEAVRGVDEDGPHDDVHGAEALQDADRPWEGAAGIILLPFFALLPC